MQPREELQQIVDSLQRFIDESYPEEKPESGEQAEVEIVINEEKPDRETTGKTQYI